MIEEMVSLLKQELMVVDSKKTYFVDSIDRLEDEGKSLATDFKGHKRISSDFTGR